MHAHGTAVGFLLLSAPFLALLHPVPAAAQESDGSWKNVAELTMVHTAGNAPSSTFGFKNTFDYCWAASALQLSAGGVRARAGIVTRTATSTPNDFTVIKYTETTTTAENYFLVRGSPGLSVVGPRVAPLLPDATPSTRELPEGLERGTTKGSVPRPPH